METILIILTTGFICLLSFYMGLKANSNEPKGEIKVPIINPIKKFQEHKEQVKESKQEKLEREILETNLENINNYDGSPLGQKDIPR